MVTVLNIVLLIALLTCVTFGVSGKGEEFACTLIGIVLIITVTISVHLTSFRRTEVRLCDECQARIVEVER